MDWSQSLAKKRRQIGISSTISTPSRVLEKVVPLILRSRLLDCQLIKVHGHHNYTNDPNIQMEQDLYSRSIALIAK